MARLLHRTRISAAELGGFVADHLDQIEPGLELVDRSFELTDGDSIDILAADRERRAVIIEVSEFAADHFLRALAHYDWFVKHAAWLERVFPADVLDPRAKPRLILVAAAPADALAAGVRHMTFTDVLLVAAQAYELSPGDTCIGLASVARSESDRPQAVAMSKLRELVEDVPISDEELSAFAAIEARRAAETAAGPVG